MATVTPVRARSSTPVGYEDNETGQAKTAITAGQLLIRISDTPTRAGFNCVWDKAPSGASRADGIALMNAPAGGTAEVGIKGEMGGYEDLAVPTRFFPSSTTAGALDDAPQAGSVSQVWATSPTTIKFSFLDAVAAGGGV